MKYKIYIIDSLVIVLIIFLNGCSSNYTLNPKDYVKTSTAWPIQLTGAEILITMKNDLYYMGELLTVRDSTMLLCENYGISNEDLSNSINQIIVIKNNNIKSITLQGENNIAEGIVIGAGVGFGIGELLGLTLGDDPESEDHFLEIIKPMNAEKKGMMYGCCFGFIGAIIGLIIGSSSSIEEIEVYHYIIPDMYDFTKLNIFSRYQGNEPAYLKLIRQ
jgi:hypothetical protein